MTVAPRPLRLAALLGSITLLGGCTPPNALRNFDGDPWVKRNAEALDRMAERLNEYGTVGMSAPLIMTPDKSFDFEVKKGPEEYFNDAKTEFQARAAALEQNVSLLGLSVTANIDTTKMATYAEQLRNYDNERIDYLRQRTERDRALNAATAANNTAAQLRRDAMLKAAEQIEDPQQKAEAQAKALDEYAKALTANAGSAPTAPAYPTAQAPTAQGVQGEASKGATQAQNVIPETYKKFVEPGKLLGESPTVTSTNRSALIVAAGDTAVEGILHAMHGSITPAKLLGRQKLFAAAMVSVTPGWRTRSDFAARLTVRPELRFETARAEVADHFLKQLNEGVRMAGECGKPLPSLIPAAISAVSPMTDTQHLKLSNSLRERKERAIQLAIALQSAGLDAGAKLFYEHLKDLEKDVLSDNREVPITAISTGSQFGYEIGPELWSQTDPSASKPKPGYRLVRQSFPTLILLSFDDDQLKPRLKCDQGRLSVVEEPHLYIEQTRRWVPLTERAATIGPIDGEIAALNDEITRAYLSGEACKGGNTSVRNNVCNQIKARGNALAEELLGSYQQQPLPLCMVVPDLPRCIDARREEARQQAEADKQQQKPAQSAAAAATAAAKPAPAKATAAKAAPAAKK